MSSVTIDGPDLTHHFHYGTNQAGELAKVIFPYGGELRWEYRNFTYQGNRTLREVQYRDLVAVSGGSADRYTIERDDTGDASRAIHKYAYLFDPSGGERQVWTWEAAPAASWLGRIMQLEKQELPGNVVKSRSTVEWATDAHGRPYVSRALSYRDPGTAYETVSNSPW